MNKAASSVNIIHALVKSASNSNVFLVNGVKLEGKIVMLSKNLLALERDGTKQAIYRHALSTVAPMTMLDRDVLADANPVKEHSDAELLASVVHLGSHIKAYMLNGICLQGAFLAEDDDMLLMSTKDSCQGVMKKAISTVAAN